MSGEEKYKNSDGFDDFSELDFEGFDDTTADNDTNGDEMFAEVANDSQFESGEADYTDSSQQKAREDAPIEEYTMSEEESEAAVEFNAMDNVINGKKRKQLKKRKKMSKRGKMIEYVAIACVCVALLSVLAYFGSMFLGGETPTQGLGGANLIVDMTDCDYYFGTTNTIDLKKTFPGGTNFKVEGVGSIRNESILTIPADSGVETFTITFDMPASGELASATSQTISCNVVEGGVNIDNWENFRKAAEAGSIIVLQDNIASGKLENLKRADHGAVIIRNDLYGNGKIINLFELVCTRTKVNSKKYGLPYLRGNGKVGGDDGIKIRNKVDDPENPVLLQDVHLTGNDMSMDAPVYEGDDQTQTEGASPVADGEETERVLLKPAGNLYGLAEADVAKRGVLLFSRYGAVLDITGGDDGDDKTNAIVKHCVIENGGKVVHVNNSNVDIEGTIIRNAADTALSVGTYANKASTIRSKNNVIANSLTGGVLFYCFDDKINEGNADATWNNLYVEGFLDIYNWKAQDGLAFLPETEDFANIANPIAASEIPKKSYDVLKGQDDAGKLYIHFAIIKIRTGGGLPRNDSQVHGYENIGYSTARENGFTKGFPIPGIASAIMKDIDVWGYYGKSDGDVTPTKILGGETEEDLKLFYKELREGRQPAEAAQ